MTSQSAGVEKRFAHLAAAPSSPLEVLVRRLCAHYPLQLHEATAIAGLVRDIATLPPHYAILDEGKPAKEAIVLLDGLACHYKILDTAKRQMTGFVVPGDFCDFGFLSSSRVTQCVMSLGTVSIGRIDLGQLSALADKLPNVVLAMMRGASVEQACARELAISLGARDALQRMAYCLCELYTRLKVVGRVDAGSFEFNLTQAELGEALGLSTVHVNRIIQHLRKQQLITMSHGKVHILDLAELARFAGFDGRYLLP